MRGAAPGRHASVAPRRRGTSAAPAPVDQPLLLTAGRDPLAAVVEACLTRRGASAAVPIVVAVSGGPDSCALLLLAAAVARRRGWPLRACAVDHGLRPESAAECRAAVALAARCGVAGRVRRVTPSRRPDGLAAGARRERYRSLEAEALAAARAVAPGPARRAAAGRPATPRALLLVAHHAEDQLETILLALVRGAGARGAGGMAEARRLASGVVIVRPLLGASREALRALLVRCRVNWATDPGNVDPGRPRGRLRRDVLPVLESLRPGAAVRAAGAAEAIRAAARLSARAAARSLRPVDAAGALAAWRRGPLAGAPEPTRRLALRRALAGEGRTASALVVRQASAAIGAAPGPARRFQLRGGGWLVVESDRVEIRADSGPHRRRRRSAPRRPG